MRPREMNRRPRARWRLALLMLGDPSIPEGTTDQRRSHSGAAPARLTSRREHTDERASSAGTAASRRRDPHRGGGPVGAVDRPDRRPRPGRSGFVSQMPPLMVVSLGLLAIGFTLTLRLQPLPFWLGIAPTLLLIGMVYGLPTFVEDAPRFAVAYLHAGFTDRIADDGTLLPFVDARFNWPLFFVLGAVVTQIAGVANALAMQPWAPIVSTLLYLPPVIVIYRSLTTDMRLVWAGVFSLSRRTGSDRTTTRRRRSTTCCTSPSLRFSSGGSGSKGSRRGFGGRLTLSTGAGPACALPCGRSSRSRLRTQPLPRLRSGRCSSRCSPSSSAQARRAIS